MFWFYLFQRGNPNCCRPALLCDMSNNSPGANIRSNA